MATLTRWSPVRDALRFQDELNRFFDFPIRGLGAEGEALNGWAPPVDIFEDAEGVTLTAELPGFAPNEIDLRVENNTLTIRGERKLEKADKKDNYRRVERFYGSFSRSFALPPTVNAERILAESKNGVLSVFLPRKEETKPKQIQVKVQG
jgi:HSP20 family protein